MAILEYAQNGKAAAVIASLETESLVFLQICP